MMSRGLVSTIAGAAALAVIAAAPAPARADQVGAMLAETDLPARKQRTFSQQIEDRLTWLGQEMNDHFSALSMDRLSIHVDGRAKRCEIWLGKGDGGMLSMRVGGNIEFEAGLAHVDARINLTIDGHQVAVALPRVDFVPASYGGEHYLEIRLPLIRGTFEPESWFE